MLKIAVIGGGVHCTENHLPALALFMDQNPGSIELIALCDRDPTVAARISRTWPFRRTYNNVQELLQSEQLDGCVAITPVEETATVAIRVLEANVPLLMEKPPGKNLDEASLICKTMENTGTPAMVSMNRRFDPILVGARDWLKKHPISRIDARMYRIARKDLHFFRDTAIHAVDAIRSIAGEITDYSLEKTIRDNVCCYKVDFKFACGANGVLHVNPDCGNIEECFEIAGPGYRLVARSGSYDEGSLVVQDNDIVVHSVITPINTQDFIKNGTYNETKAFIAALQNGQSLSPSPAEVINSVRICEEIQNLPVNQIARYD